MKAQLKAIGWQNRQGLADPANQFHYYRITRDNRILFGGYDALYYFGGKVKEEYDARPASFERLASHLFTTSPSWKGLNSPINGAAPSIPPPMLLRLLRRCLRRARLHAAGFTGLGVGASRFAANVLLDKVHGLDTELTPTVHGAAKAPALPARAHRLPHSAPDAVRTGPIIIRASATGCCAPWTNWAWALVRSPEP